jgi:hypothetical protein
MQYIYNLQSVPPLDGPTLQRLDRAAAALAGRLMSIQADQLGVSEHFKDRIRILQQDHASTLTKYVHLLAWSLHPPCASRPMALVDYGADHGLMACLAKAFGLSEVIYNDIYRPSCDEARILAQALGWPADAYVCGDIRAVADALRPKNLSYCVLISINVIEHIYDFQEFLWLAAGMSRGPMTLVLCTSANPLNPLVRARHHRQHRLWEYKDGPHEESKPGWDTMRAYRSVRREIIQQAAPNLSAAQWDRLATATRGLRRDDIETQVKKYLETGSVSVQPEHPTNTCDPLTGNWQERLLNIKKVERTLESLGYAARVFGGYYSASSSSPIKRLVKKPAGFILNQFISRLGRDGAALAPCITFHASRAATGNGNRPSVKGRKLGELIES